MTQDPHTDEEYGFDGAEGACRCEGAVITAYRELRGAGVADIDAFRACTTLYRIHHIESSLQEARILVSEWIDHHIAQRPGPVRSC